MKIFKKLAVAGLCGVALLLVGCSTQAMYADPDIVKAVSNHVVRAFLTRSEKTDESYNMWAINRHRDELKWGPESRQYRWVITDAILSRKYHGVMGFSFNVALIPDQVPTLKKGDWVDLWVPDVTTFNYQTLNVPVVLRLVCPVDTPDNGRACREAVSKEYPAGTGPISDQKPDMSKLTFTKRFDTEGKPLKQ